MSRGNSAISRDEFLRRMRGISRDEFLRRMEAVSADRQPDLVEQTEEIWQTFRQRANGGRGLTPAEAAALNELVAAGAQAAAEMVAEEAMAAAEERSRRTRTSSTGSGVRGKAITSTVLDEANVFAQLWNAEDGGDDGDTAPQGRSQTPAGVAAMQEMIIAGEREMLARRLPDAIIISGDGVWVPKAYADMTRADHALVAEAEEELGPFVMRSTESETFFDRYTERVRPALERSKKALGPSILITTQRCWEDMVRADVQARADALSEGDLVTLGKSHRHPYRHPEQKKHTYRHPAQKKHKR
jgi:hypothetical protein